MAPSLRRQAIKRRAVVSEYLYVSEYVWCDAKDALWVSIPGPEGTAREPSTGLNSGADTL